MITEELLLSYEACILHFSKGDVLFHEGDTPVYFHQVLTGEIKMNNFNDDGKEFIQGIFTAGGSFGEPPLFIGKPYPANAEALTDAEVYVLPKEKFFTLLKANPSEHVEMTTVLAQRLYYKAVMASEISSHDAEHRILKLIDYFKELVGLAAADPYLVNLTRQQIADLTGLRVETVIRAIKSLEKKGEVTLIERKIMR